MAHSRLRLTFLLLITLVPTRVSPIDPISLFLGSAILAHIVLKPILDPPIALFIKYCLPAPYGEPTAPATPVLASVTNVAGTHITNTGPVTITHAAPITNIAQSTTTVPVATQRQVPAQSKTVLDYYTPNWKTTALAVYIALQARLMYLASYLSQPTLPSRLFSQYTLNELLLLQQDAVQEALREYLFDTYAITNQHELKLGIARFLRDLDAEISATTEYRRYCSVGQAVGDAHRSLNNQVMWVVASTIPFVGPLIAKIPLPTIDQFFFLKQNLKEELPERLSKLLFLKTTFLQTPFTA